MGIPHFLEEFRLPNPPNHLGFINPGYSQLPSGWKSQVQLLGGNHGLTCQKGAKGWTICVHDRGKNLCLDRSVSGANATEVEKTGGQCAL